MSKEKLDSIKQMLKDKQKEDDEKYNTLNEHLQKLIDAEDEISEKLYPSAIQLISKELHDLNTGMNTSYEMISGLLDDRNKIVKWIHERNEDHEFLLKILDIIEKKIDEFDDYIKSNKSKLDDVEDMKNKQNEIFDLRDELVKYQKKIQEREETELEEKKDFPYIG